jgi:prepilin-type N-terminal cleavage/methylation domain-containing protein
MSLMPTKRLHSQQQGFTTVEIVVVLIIIGVLLGLILATHSGIVQKQNNIERQRDIDELRVELESYYSQYTKYPTLAQLNNSAWRASYMKGLVREVMRDPDGSRYNLAVKPAKDIYAYDVTATSGRKCNDVHVICTQYTLTATLDGGGTYVENNLD